MFLYGALNDEDGLGRVELGSGVVLVAHLDSGQQYMSSLLYRSFQVKACQIILRDIPAV
jgi:hypothetical protein